MSISSSVSSSLAASSSSSAEAGGRGFWLRRFDQSVIVTWNGQGFRFAATVYGARDMNDHVFRYLRRPLNPRTGATEDVFDGVCSAADMADFPEDAPRAGEDPAWFRLPTVDLVLRSQREVHDAWTILVDELGALVEALNLQDTLITGIDVAIGAPAADPRPGPSPPT